MDPTILQKKKRPMSFSSKLALGFACIILLGAILLHCPFSSRAGVWTPFLDALFTATSATCVTGLVVVDTYTHWSIWGQLIILCMIQVGGLGYITVGSFLAVALRRRIGLKSRQAIHESINTAELSGVVRLVKNICAGTALFEGIGAILLACRFVPEYGLLEGIYMGVFHSVSAFCNAGFDLLGRIEPYCSFVNYKGDILINLTFIALILIGGAGFLVWDDIRTKKLNWKRYRLHTKIMLAATAILVFGGAVIFWLFERDASLAGLSAKETILASLFGAVTPRTAGFNTVDTAAMSEGGRMFSIILMFIGGGVGSTAGGAKVTNTAALLFFCIAAVKGTKGVNVFRRRLENDAVTKAGTVVLMYLGTEIIGTLLMCLFETHLPLSDIMFEVFSAVNTVGMSTGITRELSVSSRILLMIYMFYGRLGSMTFAMLFAGSRKEPAVKLPEEKILVG